MPFVITFVGSSFCCDTMVVFVVNKQCQISRVIFVSCKQVSGRSHSYVMHIGSVKCNNCKININILCQMSRFVFKISLVLSSVTIIRSHTWAYFADTFVPFFGFHCNFRHCNFSYCSTRALSMLRRTSAHCYSLLDCIRYYNCQRLHHAMRARAAEMPQCHQRKSTTQRTDTIWSSS